MPCHVFTTTFFFKNQFHYSSWECAVAFVQGRVMGGLVKDRNSRGNAFVAPQTQDLFVWLASDGHQTSTRLSSAQLWSIDAGLRVWRLIAAPNRAPFLTWPVRCCICLCLRGANLSSDPPSAVGRTLHVYYLDGGRIKGGDAWQTRRVCPRTNQPSKADLFATHWPCCSCLDSYLPLRILQSVQV